MVRCVFGLGLSLSLLCGGIAFADGPCEGNYRCGPETYENPSRPRPSIEQPEVREPLMGFCGQPLPRDKAYQARLDKLTCGEGADRTVRRALEVPQAIRERWEILSNSGRADAQEEMQRIRQQQLSWSGTIQFAMYESWNWTEIVGDFDASRCPMERFWTTCRRSREEKYLHEWKEDILERYCKTPASRSSGGGGSGFSGGGGSGSSSGTERSQPASPWSSGSPRGGESGQGERPGDFRRDSNDSWGPRSSLETQPEGQSENPPAVATAQPQPFRFRLVGSAQAQTDDCAEWAHRKVGERPRSEWRWRPMSQPHEYSCLKERPTFCTWPVVRREVRDCPRHTARYSVNYAHDPEWKPGYRHPTDARRNYHPLLPNKFDLLTGEEENVLAYVNTGVTETLRPNMVFRNRLADREKPWNEYQFEASPEALDCRFRMNPEIRFTVRTLGRNHQRAPNPLTFGPDALRFEIPGRNRPSVVVLTDTARQAQLDAARLSRTFPRPDGAGDEDPNALYTDNGTPLPGASASGGYWQETRFLMQLFRHDRWGREVRITMRPESFSANQVDIFDDSVSISLEGRDGMDRFYRPGGPLEFLFGRIYRAFNVELTPGQRYFLRLRVVSRGLPFYESGCVGGKAICEGQEGSVESYSEPVDIPFVADPRIDNRSWFKRFKDFQATVGGWL